MDNIVNNLEGRSGCGIFGRRENPLETGGVMIEEPRKKCCRVLQLCSQYTIHKLVSNSRGPPDKSSEQKLHSSVGEA